MVECLYSYKKMKKTFIIIIKNTDKYNMNCSKNKKSKSILYDKKFIKSSEFFGMIKMNIIKRLDTKALLEIIMKVEVIKKCNISRNNLKKYLLFIVKKCNFEKRNSPFAAWGGILTEIAYSETTKSRCGLLCSFCYVCCKQ